MESEARGEVAPADEATDEASTDGISASISGAAAPVPAVPIPAVPVPPAPAPPEVNPGVAEVNSEVNSEVNPHVEVWQRRLESACRLDVNADCKKPNCKFCKTQEFKKNYIPMVNVNDVCCITVKKSTKKAAGEFYCAVCGVTGSAASNVLGNMWSHCEGRTHFIAVAGKTAVARRCASNGHSATRPALTAGSVRRPVRAQGGPPGAWDIRMGHNGTRAWDLHGTCMGHNGTRAWDTMDMGQWDVHWAGPTLHGTYIGRPMPSLWFLVSD